MSNSRQIIPPAQKSIPLAEIEYGTASCGMHALKFQTKHCKVEPSSTRYSRRTAHRDVSFWQARFQYAGMCFFDNQDTQSLQLSFGMLKWKISISYFHIWIMYLLM